MKCASKSSDIKIYYQADDLATNQEVIFSVWDDTGTDLVSAFDASAEIDDCGIYYLDFATPNYDTYLLVKSGLKNGSHPKSFIIKSG